MMSLVVHAIVTKLKIMHMFGLILPNWLKICRLAQSVYQIKHYYSLNMVAIATVVPKSLYSFKVIPRFYPDVK